MGLLSSIYSLSDHQEKNPIPYSVRREILVAIATVMVVGLVLATFFGAPWMVPLAFFSLALAALLPLGRAVDHQRQKIFGRNLLMVV